MLIDKYGRKIDYLRISVTQKCNFRCKYCMPNTPFDFAPKEDILTFQQMFSFVKIVIDAGIKKIRITGGEPLIRSDLSEFIEMIASYADVDLALTTNGYFLKKYAKSLKTAGLKRINISLDTLNPQKAHLIAGRDVLGEVLNGIDEALKYDLKVKFNTVALKGINDGEICDLIDFAKSRRSMIRFIEYMENSHAKAGLQGLRCDEILSKIGEKHKYKEFKKFADSPATIYELEDGYKFGIIDPHKHDFCATCNRIRLSADGLLIPCLYFDEAKSIKEALRNCDLEKANEILKDVLASKPEKNRWAEVSDGEISDRAFYQTGG